MRFLRVIMRIVAHSKILDLNFAKNLMGDRNPMLHNRPYFSYVLCNPLNGKFSGIQQWPEPSHDHYSHQLSFFSKATLSVFGQGQVSNYLDERFSIVPVYRLSFCPFPIRYLLRFQY